MIRDRVRILYDQTPPATQKFIAHIALRCYSNVDAKNYAWQTRCTPKSESLNYFKLVNIFFIFISESTTMNRDLT